MPIIQLSDKTINKIAAGQVVQDPQSVVKELVENSIDAGATYIEIEIENAGKNLIKISDNGSGIAKADLKMALQRHATSKLIEEDLSNIHYFGFRGEALPSIAAVSQITISSKTASEEYGFQIKAIAGNIEEIQPCAQKQGTKIEVRNLFSYTPTKLKFMRSDRAEKAAILQSIYGFALSHPHVEFKLIYENKTLLHCNPSKITDLHKIKEIFSQDLAENFVEVNFHADNIKISGYISKPTHSNNGSIQHCFINQRIIKDKFITTAIKVGYYNLSPDNRPANYILNISLNPSEVDVNIHPAKTEVRFKNPNQLKEAIIYAIRNTLANETSVAGTVTHNFAKIISTPKPAHNYNIPTPRLDIPNTNSFRDAAQPIYNMPKYEDKVEDQHKLGFARFQIANKYIVAQTKDAFILVDQHAAHERITLQYYKAALEKHKQLEAQYLLIPKIISIPKDAIEVFLDNIDNLEALGIKAKQHGINEIAIYSTPKFFDQDLLQMFISEFISLSQTHNPKELFNKYLDEILGNIACKASIRAGRALSIDEMNALLREIEKTEFSSQCNHGRPTFLILTEKEMNKIFERG